MPISNSGSDLLAFVEVRNVMCYVNFRKVGWVGFSVPTGCFQCVSTLGMGIGFRLECQAVPSPVSGWPVCKSWCYLG
jgi:hypothetical protein